MGLRITSDDEGKDADVVGLLVRPEFYETNEKANQERHYLLAKKKPPAVC